MNISFIIIHFGEEKKLLDLILSIKKEFIYPEIIVVNNDFCKLNLDLEYIDNSGRSYPSAVNRGVYKSKGIWSFLLSPANTLISGFSNAISKCMKEFSDIEIFAPAIVNEKLEVQPSVRRHFNIFNFIIRKWKISVSDHPAENDYVQQPMSAALLVKRELIIDYPFDERFFLYFSDVDWCRRMMRKNKKIIYCPYAKVEHEIGGTTKDIGNQRNKYLFEDFIKIIFKYGLFFHI